MARSRNRLHVDKLVEFSAYCQSKGWAVEESKGYEALRLRKNGQLATVYRRDSDGRPLVHYTTWGQSETLLSNWLRDRGRFAPKGDDR